MERQNQSMATNLPPNVFIHYATPNATNNGEKSYYKMETIPFQTNTTININQPISIINQSCLINQNNGGAGFQTAAVLNNQCVPGTPTNYVQLSGNWNHGMQQVNSEEQMIYQIMYPIIDSTGALEGQQIATKQTTVDANVLTAGTCTVLTPAKAITGKRHIVSGYNVVEKQNQFTNTEVVSVEVVKDEQYSESVGDDPENLKKKGKRKKGQQDENELYACVVCGEAFKSKGSLRFHMFHHNPKTKNKFQCIGCSEGFEKEKQKQEHELTCTRNYKLIQFECCFCDHPFDTPKGLRKHENKHRPIRKTKRYRHTCVCIECNKAFDAIYSLKMHIQKYHKKSHVKPMDEKPFACSECGLGFKYERSKLKHEFKAHMKQEAASL